METDQSTEYIAACLDITGQVVIDPERFGIGGCADVYKGVWNKEADAKDADVQKSVAVKVLRVVRTDVKAFNKLIERLNRETRVWILLDHPNVVPFYGICTNFDAAPALVSEMCSGGNVVHYLKKNPGVNKPALILEVTKGLEYLHSKNIVHGDLQPHNVVVHVVDVEGQPSVVTARICDFGRSAIITATGFTTDTHAGVIEYMCPELVAGREDRGSDGKAKTKLKLAPAMDVYSFAMVALLILSGRKPFWYKPNVWATAVAILSEERPKFQEYTGLSEGMKSIMEDCWKHAPGKRLGMPEVARRLPAV